MEEAHIFYRFEETVYYWKLLCTKQFSIEYFEDGALCNNI